MSDQEYEPRTHLSGGTGRTVCGKPVRPDNHPDRACGDVDPGRLVGDAPTCAICVKRGKPDYLKRIAWAYGCAAKGSKDEKNLLDALLEHVRSKDDIRGRIAYWVRTRLGSNLLESRWERSLRVLEEAIELAQAHDVDTDTVLKLVARVYSRPKGEPTQELAGVQVCLHAMATSMDADLDGLTAQEVARIERMDGLVLHKKQNDKAKEGVALFAGYDVCERCGAKHQGSNMCMECGRVSH